MIPENLYEHALRLVMETSIPLLHKEARSEYALAYEYLQECLHFYEKAERKLRFALQGFEIEQKKAQEDDTADNHLNDEDIKRIADLAHEMITKALRST